MAIRFTLLAASNLLHWLSSARVFGVSTGSYSVLQCPTVSYSPATEPEALFYVPVQFEFQEVDKAPLSRGDLDFVVALNIPEPCLGLKGSFQKCP